jgi:hypothetical protein
LQSIRDAIKPKELEMGYMMKKTHKGEEEIINIRGGVDLTQMKDAEVAGDALQGGKINTIDDLLSRLNGGSPATSGIDDGDGDTSHSANAGEKRPATSSADDLDDHPDTKKARTGTPPDELRSSMGSIDDLTPTTAANSAFGVSTWDNAIVTDSWESAGDLNGMDLDGGYVVRSPIDDYSGRDPTGRPFEPRTPSASPPPLPATSSSTEDITIPPWTGLVRMQQVGKFFGSCKQVAGRRVHGGSKAWEDILPPNVTIEGRIDTKNVNKYVKLQMGSSSKEVVAIEFTAAGEAGSEDREGFKTLVYYFHDKNRYAVVGQNYISVKDMYLVPVKAGETPPDMIMGLSNTSSHFSGVKSYDALYGVIVLDKSVFSKSHPMNKKGSSSASNLSSTRSSGSKIHHRHRSSSGDKTKGMFNCFYCNFPTPCVRLYFG